MALPQVHGEFGIVKEPEVKFSGNGNVWLTVRCVAKDRKRDATGNWTDGDTTFIDVVMFGKNAEHLVESVYKGDTINIVGKLVQKSWEDNEGNKRSTYQIIADQVGVSLKWGPAKTGQMIGADRSLQTVKEQLGADELEEVPF